MAPDGTRARLAGLSRGRKLGLGGVAVIAVGAFLPWITTAAGQQVLGLALYGPVTLVGALLVGGLAVLSWTRRTQLMATVLALIVGSIVVTYVASLPLSTVGVGVYATAAGGGLVLVGALDGLRER